MKKWQCFCACVCVLALAITAKAQDSEGQPATPKLKFGEASSSVGEATSKTSTNSEDLDKRLSKLEKSMAELLSQLIAMQPKLVTKDDVQELIKQKLSAQVAGTGTSDKGQPQEKVGETKTNPEQTVPSKPAATFDEKRLKAMEDSLRELDLSVKKIAAKLETIGPSNPGEKRIQEGILVVRNLTGDSQRLYVEGKEWRIPGDGRAYEIPTQITRSDNAVLTQVWPYDKPKVRKFQSVDGKMEVRFDIKLLPVE